MPQDRGTFNTDPDSAYTSSQPPRSGSCRYWIRLSGAKIGAIKGSLALRLVRDAGPRVAAAIQKRDQLQRTCRILDLRQVVASVERVAIDLNPDGPFPLAITANHLPGKLLPDPRRKAQANGCGNAKHLHRAKDPRIHADVTARLRVCILVDHCCDGQPHNANWKPFGHAVMERTMQRGKRRRIPEECSTAVVILIFVAA